MTEVTREQEEKVALKAMRRLFALWKLDPEESAGLLKMAREDWCQVVTGVYDQKLTDEQRMRISFLMGIHRSLSVIFQTEICHEWVKLPNSGPIMNGKRPLDVMLSEDWEYPKLCV